MVWEWSKVDDKGLARYVTSEAANLVRLPENRQDVARHIDGRRQLVEAIYNALVNTNKDVRYAPEKYHPSAALQPIRTPSEVLDTPGEGTCLDLAALFCGLCLGYELLPLLIVLEGHALAAVSLSHGLPEWDAINRAELEFFGDEPLSDADQLRELIDSGRYLAIECTGFAYSKSLPESLPEGVGRTKKGVMPFERAAAAGREQLDRLERPFRFALDIAVAHFRWRLEPINVPSRAKELLPGSYQEDIRRLQQYSRSTADALSEFSEILVGSTQVKIDRQATHALRAAALEGSLLVVGEPGAGKSGALHDLVETLHSEGRDVVFLAVDKLDASSKSVFRSKDLELTNDLEDVLKNWSSQEPGWLVIDALDAAKSATAFQSLCDLISKTLRTKGRWRVVASIRKFDLRYHHKLQQLFRGEPSVPTEFCDSEFAKIRHINIPILSDDELGQIGKDSQLLADFIDVAGQELQALLRVPFNLRLVGDLIGAEVAIESLALIQTQIELLDLYWQERVVRSDDALGDAREALLRQAVEKMVATRSLHVNRSDVLGDAVASTALSPYLQQVLSAHVLTEWRPSPNAKFERYILTFSHHVLFDYAVARLVLRGEPQTPVERLERELELVLAIRPSLVFHFQYLWFLEQEDHTSFWDLLFRVLRTQAIPEIGKLIGSSVAAELITHHSDYEPLFAMLEGADSTFNNIAEQALRHLIGALLAAPPPPNRPLVGPNAPPWCELLERCSRSGRLPVAYTVNLLLSTICEHPEQLTSNQQNAAGITARRLLDFAWNQAPPERWLVTHSLQAVCRTFESDPPASAAILRRCLEPEHLASQGFQEMFWFAQEVSRLISLDATLVEDVYRAVFTYSESRDTPTHFTSERILLQLTSTIQQDYNQGRYQLAEVYPEFLEGAPSQATHALVAVIEAYVADKPPRRTLIEEKFDFNGQEAIIRTDGSKVWDSQTYRDDEPLKMLDAFGEYLQQLSEEPERVEERQKLINIIVSENQLAVLWRRLLVWGTKAPQTLGQQIRFLAWARPILTSCDTTRVVGDFLGAVFSTLNPTEREQIERTILSIPDGVGEERREVAEYNRNRLLGCLSLEAVVTEDAKQLLQELTNQGGSPPNESFNPFIGVTVSPYGEKEYLTDQGVPVEAEPNRRIQELEKLVKEFAAKHLNSSPKAEEIENILPTLRSLHEALATAEVDGVHSKLRDYAWGYLAEACERIAKSKTLCCEESAGSFARQVLLQASEHPEPVPHPEDDAQFDESPAWGSPAARIAAAEGLTQLARHPSCVNEEVLNAIEHLSRDALPAVRYQVAADILALYQTAPDLMWSILERMCREEPSRGVLQALLGYPVGSLASSQANRVATLTKIVFDRVTDGKGASKVRDFCTSIFTGLHLWQNHLSCGEVVYAIADNPAEFSGEARRIVADLRDYLTLGPIDPPDSMKNEVRHRAFTLMSRLLLSTREAFRRLEVKYESSQPGVWSDEDQEKVKQLALLVDSIASQIYFASGAFDEKRSEERPSAAVLGIQGKRRFLQEVSPVLDELAVVALPRGTHYLLQTLAFLVDLDPESVFLRIGRVVSASRASGYQYESLGADLIVRFIERFLAEYRYILRENEECRKVLIEILDTFVGWHSARRLTYRMEEIFR